MHAVLDEVDLELQSGASAAIVGRSGSGKSTLLNLLSGIDRPDGGTIELDGREIGQLREPARTVLRRESIGFVYQFFNLIPTLSVEENVLLALELKGMRGAQARHRTRGLLDRVGLGSRAASTVDMLSGGEQQRVAIARALVHEPRLVLADEPTGNLDEATAREIVPLLTELVREREAMLIVVTHDRALAAAADRVWELRDGRLHEPQGSSEGA
ncbi:MAG TPA: ABC transporter ATP-binding protein [Steroidobacteraceae bacterium]|nr:ABC transporter ATP-binding protein [Steroidobacteraceae bacterium]